MSITGTDFIEPFTVRMPAIIYNQLKEVATRKHVSVDTLLQCSIIAGLSGLHVDEVLKIKAEET